MRVTEGELLCFNSIIDGRALLGVKLKVPIIAKETEFIKQTTKSMQEKGIADSEGKLTKIGAIPIMALEDYKKAKKHLFINDLRISFNHDGRITVIKKHGNQYEMHRMNREILYIEIIKQYKHLRDAQDKEKPISTSQKIPFKQWQFELEKVTAENMIFIKEYLGATALETCIYYWIDGNGYAYSLEKQEKRIVGARDIRIELMKYFSLDTTDSKEVGIDAGN